jgi:hypothetical protein
MKNSLHEIIRERLENRLEWRNYLGWLLTHRDLQMMARKKFYEDKPFLDFILKIYFLPYNILKYLIYKRDRYKFEMIQTEIQMLKKAKGDDNE